MKNDAVCHRGFASSSIGNTTALRVASFSSFRNNHAIIAPITNAKPTAPNALANPISQPRIFAVRMMAKALIAGPEYKNAVAGPRPAPIRQIPENKGNTVHEHTARIVPETDATPYDATLGAPGTMSTPVAADSPAVELF